ncbi:DUF3238 domain-containing protein [Siminovitchia fortis]|uniref:DUF3238 domain-containing protein n=1 Tax=Siminovitchia fortis TaxID=254758 RepID=A0A443IMG9_9BACI|nr:DUF3238 domain-containing protein [Siminovitchia fortis]RWR06535.1 DUF3238 domain-containing protein [Siminovitchia fortis]WHY80837.1 DUF3238 domain-containing protein [Siminovitchia fortis]
MFRRYVIPLISLIGTALVMIGKKLQTKIAYPKSFPIKAVEQTTNEIIFHFKSEKGPFRIYREGRLIYEGEDESFTDSELASGTTYLYTIEIGSRRGTPERMKVQTSTAAEFRESENKLEDCTQTAVISRSFVGMEWEPIEGVEEYLIYRNGKRIAKVEEPFFVDRWVRGQVEYTYQVYAERPLEDFEKDPDERESRVKKKRAKDQNAVMEKFQMTKMLDPLEEILKSENEPFEKKEWQFLYKTFSGRSWIKNPNEASPYRYFKGEGRGFDPASKEYRSMAEIVVTPDGSEIRLNKDIGTTKGYGMLRILKKEETASDEGIQLEDIETGEEKVSFILNHSVQNPLDDLPAVDYRVRANLYRSGYFDIAGVHEQTPDHEVYLKHGVQRSWTTLHQSEDEGVERMAPMHWRVSNFK